jgi:hypothetical protein
MALPRLRHRKEHVSAYVGFDLRDFMRPKGGQSANSPANTSRSRHRRTVGLPNRRSSAATRRTSGRNPLSGLPCPPSVAPLTFDAGYAAVKKKGGASYPAPKFGTISGLVQRVRTQTISQARPDTKTLTSNRYSSCRRVSHTTRASHPREVGSSVNVNVYELSAKAMPTGAARFEGLIGVWSKRQDSFGAPRPIFRTAVEPPA